MHSILVNLALLDSGLVANQGCSIQHLKQAGLHLVCVVVLPGSKPHFAERFGGYFYVELVSQHRPQECLNLIGLLTCKIGQIDVEVADWDAFRSSRMHLAYQVVQQVIASNYVIFQNQFENSD